MPKGICIEDKSLLELFRRTVENYLPFSIKINKNFGQFSTFIYQKTGEQMSVSTLRRIFQYESKSYPSLFTLDTICKSIDYANWRAFVESSYKNHEEEHYEILSNLRYNGYEDADEFRRIFNDFVNTDYCYDITLALVQAAVRKSDMVVLSTLFDLPVVFDADVSERRMRRNLYFTQELGMTLRNNKNLIYKLIPIYAQNKAAYVNYIERYLAYFNQPTDSHYSNVYVKRNMNLLKIYEAYVLCWEGQSDLSEEKLLSYNHLYFFPNTQKLTKTHFEVVRRYIEAEKRKQLTE